MRKLFQAILLPLMLAAAQMAGAQSGKYPSKPIEVIITSTPGSTSDVLTRFLGKGVTDVLGAPVVVVSKASASGLVGASQAARARPDGYTVFLGGNTTMAANVHLFKELPYDPVKDLDPVTLVTINPLVLVVRSDLPIKSVSELIDYAKKRPGQMNYGAGNSGGKVSVALLESLAGIKATEIPYKGASQAALDLVGGRVDFMIVDPVVVKPFVDEGKLRPLAVTSSERIASLSEVPTMAEAGVKGYEYTSFLGYFVPHGTPKEIVEVLRGAFVKAVESDEAKSYFHRMGMIGRTSTPDGLAQFQREQITTWKKLVRIAGLEAQ